jgi:hypothetical protein
VFLYLLVTQLLELPDEVTRAAVVDGADRECDQSLNATARPLRPARRAAVQGASASTARMCPVLVPGKRASGTRIVFDANAGGTVGPRNH